MNVSLARSSLLLLYRVLSYFQSCLNKDSNNGKSSNIQQLQVVDAVRKRVANSELDFTELTRALANQTRRSKKWLRSLEEAVPRPMGNFVRRFA
jgi:uncharacterized membrane protein YjjP (DUF1212 family)